MNIYVLNTIATGKIETELLCKNINIKGMIVLDEACSGKPSEYYDYSLFCKQREIECIKVVSYNLSDPRDKQLLTEYEIDLIIVSGWQRLIPDWLIKHCSIGIIGAHGSHEGIERGRGRSPQNWAILTGQKHFSLSIFWIEEGTDNGDIIATKDFDYLPTDTILTSYIKVSVCKVELIIEGLKNGTIAQKEGIPQGAEGYYLPKRIKEDGMIDWNRDAVDISNMVRALTHPYPGAYTMYKDIEFCIWIARPVVLDTKLFDGIETGTLVSVIANSALIKCGKNFLQVDDCSNFDSLVEGMVFESADYRRQIQEIIERHKRQYDTQISDLIMNEIRY